MALSKEAWKAAVETMEILTDKCMDSLGFTPAQKASDDVNDAPPFTPEREEIALGQWSAVVALATLAYRIAKETGKTDALKSGALELLQSVKESDLSDILGVEVRS